ncbi:MAG: pirin family protein [Cyanothece sp. SIO2G6]|nr:pirin family protein [Cyanothece sp. SIO2G6]
MLTIRKSDERGLAEFGWLKSFHTFSFGEYYDPNHMNFGMLRVINDDRIKGSSGFPTHGHRDMEIITYVLDGALEHKDTLGNVAVIKPGEVQRMSAGTGIAHSEYNHSATDLARFLQIWVIPDTKGLEPGYEQKYFDPTEGQGKLRLVGSRDGRDGSVTIHQDLNLYAGHLQTGDTVDFALAGDRQAWVQIARGSVAINGQVLVAGDGAAVSKLEQMTIEGRTDDAELLIFDLAA